MITETKNDIELRKIKLLIESLYNDLYINIHIDLMFKTTDELFDGSLGGLENDIDNELKQ